jgi:AcrR family transcriptional regulator
MPKISEEHALARRQQIIDAAYRCFARKGFHQTTMRDIYEEASLSAGAVYHYFAGKHEIIAASFDFDYQRSVDLFEAAAESKDPFTLLSDLIAFLFSGLKEATMLGAARVNIQGWGEAVVNPSLRATVERFLNIYRDLTTKIIQSAQAKGQLDSTLDATAFSHMLLSLYFGLELQLAFDPELDVDTYANVVRKLLQAVSAQSETPQEVNE